ncbi:MAG: hypothetical protein IT430_13275 [Phycisphaerales bacterium]|nr:hypothetical protein [Phycisphaerales bacterium]
MSEVSRILFEVGAGTLATVLGILSQCRAARRSRQEADSGGGMSLEEIGLQLDALDALIEAETEPAVRVRREDHEWRAMIRRTLLDIDDLAALPDPPPRGAHDELLQLGPLGTAVADAISSDPQAGPGERARVFLSTGRFFNGNGGSFSFLLVGNRGRQQLTISSGASQSDIVAWIRQFSEFTGMVGLVDTANPDLIRLTSLRRGANHFVGAGRISGSPHNAFYDENRANPADRQLDFGA